VIDRYRALVNAISMKQLLKNGKVSGVKVGA